MGPKPAQWRPVNIYYATPHVQQLPPGHRFPMGKYERLRERNGKRYFADVSKLMPLVSITIALLGFMFVTGLYLDTVKG